MFTRAASLRSTLTAVMVTLALLAVGAAVTLVVLTTYLHREAESLGDSMNDIRIAQELQVALLRYERGAHTIGPASAGSPIPDRSEMELLAVQKFGAIRIQAPNQIEAELVSAARGSVQRYLSTSRDLDKALEGLDRLVAFEVDEGRAMMARAADWDRIADIAGSTMAILLLLGVVGTVIWLRTSALDPVLGIRAAIHRLSHGDAGARAPTTGPSELREIGLAFNNMAERLSRNRESQLVYLAGVAHDLRNPLGPLKMASALLLDRNAMPAPDQLRKTLAVISRQVDRLDRMIGDLLDATRIEAGQLELRVEPTDIRDAITHVVDLYRTQGTPHQIDVSLPDQPLSLRCDRIRVEQVITNLLSNAIKYSSEGAPIEIEARDGYQEVTIDVADRGIGIAEADLPTIFEPFKRVGNSRDSVPGSGLGLSVARRVVQAHGGRIEVASRPGGGSVFTVVLPRSPAADSPNANRQLKVHGSRSKEMTA